MAPPPLKEIVANPFGSMDDDDATKRKTHIEVCVRVRPLVIGRESSNSFLSDRAAAAAGSSLPTPSSRKAGIPRPLRRETSQRGNKRTAGGFSPGRKEFFGDDPAAAAAAHVSTHENDIYAWNVTGNDTVQQSQATDIVPGRTHSYTLDHVYGPESTTQEVYDKSVLDLVHAAMDGYHASVLAYGQTSTGKTHTMTGTKSQPGLIPRAIRECFNYLRRQTHPREYLLRVSYLEVYKEHIRDLLSPNPATAAPVRLFDSTDGLIIKGLREEVVTDADQVFQILSEGEKRRQVGATNLNQHSSRSHVIVRIWIESRMSTDGFGGMATTPRNGGLSTSSSLSSSRNGGSVRVSSLSLVDLAGSESVKLTGSNERRSEGHYINQSLMTLGKVVYALSEIEDNTKNTKHIPYRDSKLTRLLQPSLSGNAQVVLVCCISPMVQHLEESHNTFKFAVRAKKIPQKAKIQEVGDEKTLLQSYRDEIEVLRQQLKEAQEVQEKLLQQSSSSTAPNSSPTSAESFFPTADVGEDEIQELATAIQTMEKLILKSKPISPLQRPEDMLDALDSDEDDNGDEDLLALALAQSDTFSVSTPARSSVQTPVRAPPAETDKNLEIELARIQGLLGTVLRKRRGMVKGSYSEQEVRHLKAQLEQQEASSTLRKADSSFLQKQLEEKDDLLMEVSKILEAVEVRQAELEKENYELRREIAMLRAERRNGMY